MNLATEEVNCTTCPFFSRFSSERNYDGSHYQHEAGRCHGVPPTPIRETEKSVKEDGGKVWHTIRQYTSMVQPTVTDSNVCAIHPNIKDIIVLIPSEEA